MTPQILLIFRSFNGGPSREVPLDLKIPMQVTTNADCAAIARAIMYCLPAVALFLSEGVRVQAGDAGAVYTVYELVKAERGTNKLEFGVHMPEFWGALALRIVSAAGRI
jgi:hypothetical protein